MPLDNIKFADDIRAILAALELAAKDRYHDDYLLALYHVAVALRLGRGGDAMQRGTVIDILGEERRVSRG